MCKTNWKNKSRVVGTSLPPSVINIILISCLSCKLAIFWEKPFSETAPTAFCVLVTDTGGCDWVHWDHLSLLPHLASGEKLPQLTYLALASDDLRAGLYFSVLSVLGIRAWLPRSAPCALGRR